MKVSNRLQKLRQKLAEQKLDGIFVSQSDNRYYLSGFDGSAGYLMITPQTAVLATDFRYIEQGKMEAPDYRIFQISGSTDWFPQLTAELNINRLAFESAHLTLAQHKQLTDVLTKASSPLQLVPVEGLVESLRIIKEPEEIELMTRAASIGDRAVEYIKSVVHAGMTELEAAWEMEKFLREHGSQTVPFEVIFASGPNAALPHAKPSSRPLRNGEPIVIDVGARFAGYSSDLTRTICLGTPDATFRKVYDIVLNAQRTAWDGIREGMNGEEADALARKFIATAGYGDAFGHSLGHGVGLATHEPPRLGPNSTEWLTSGMVFSIEPGIYLPGWGGVRIEDLVVMEKGKIRSLSNAPK
ncbi:MAG: aminopeptidase P family protein [Chloroflexota bacterium]